MTSATLTDYGHSAFDVTIVGAGHAGCEAASAAARLGCRALMITFSLNRVAAMSCNPAIGGLGKGHIVKEVDALGGMMGLAADYAGIQFRILNRSKGPAVRGTRAQSDMKEYLAFWIELLRHGPTGVTCMEGEATGLKKVGNEFHVTVDSDFVIASKSVILTTGTFLGGLMHTGLQSHPGGRLGDRASQRLSGELQLIGVRLGRLKTGTCPRLDGRTIDFDAMDRQNGDDPTPLFSFLSDTPRLPQRPCYITYTNLATHEAIRRGLDRSPLFCGLIKGRGPRYCPSIEDKVVRFPDRDRHQIFLEPEGLNTEEYYPNGISTSLPEDVQVELVHSIPGLEHAEILKYGYAVEYDYVYPTQLFPSLMTKAVPGLFCAGQINGTSGYEEAAGQGLMAGVNAARFVQKNDPVVLRRDQAYIGVMIDDLVTAGAAEPYRMFTSRAEHRMLLREDNADVRLTPLGRDLGLVSDERWRRFQDKKTKIDHLTAFLKTARVKDGGVSVPAIEYLRKPGVSCKDTVTRAGGRETSPAAVENAVEILVKLDGYIERERRRIDRIATMDEHRIPDQIDYTKVPGLRAEVVEKLNIVRPLTLGQASRIPGVTPAAISMLVIFLTYKRPWPR